MVNSNLVKTHICAECEYPLVERWNPATSKREIKCGNDKSHVGFKPWNEGKTELERKARQMAVDNKQVALAKYSGVQKLSESQAVEVVSTLWPGAPDIEKRKAILLCVQYGLNPLRKHLFLVPYNNEKTGETSWEIIMGITAKRQMTRDKVGAYSYIDNTPRLMTKDEQIMYVGEVDDSRYWGITKVKSKDGSIAQGYGFWAKTKTYKDGKGYPNKVKGEDKGNSMQNMAMIHSESAALERLSGESMPTGVTVGDEHFIEADNGNGQLIDGETGEIIEGGKELPAPSAPTASPAVKTVVTPTETGKAQPEGKQGVNAVFQTWGEVAAHIANNGLDTTQFLKKAGKKVWTDFTSYDEAIKEMNRQLQAKPAQSRIMPADSGEPF